MGDAHIADLAEIVLQLLQPPDEGSYFVRVIQRRQRLAGIAQLFQSDAQAMPLLRILIGEILTAPPYDLESPIEHVHGKKADRFPQILAALVGFPAATVEPPQQSE